MVRKFGFALLTLAIGFGLFAPNTVAEDSKKLEIATTEEIMKAVPHKTKGLVAKTVAGAKEEKWDDIKKIGETLKKYGSDLGKNKQEKGSDESWAKMCKTFEDDERRRQGNREQGRHSRAGRGKDIQHQLQVLPRCPQELMQPHPRRVVSVRARL